MVASIKDRLAALTGKMRGTSIDAPPTPSPDLSASAPPSFCGWVKKFGGGVIGGTSFNRWCELHAEPPTLRFYADEKATHPKGECSLVGVRASCAGDILTLKPAGSAALATKLKLASAEEAARWEAAIAAAGARAARAPAAASPAPSCACATASPPAAPAVRAEAAQGSEKLPPRESVVERASIVDKVNKLLAPRWDHPAPSSSQRWLSDNVGTDWGVVNKPKQTQLMSAELGGDVLSALQTGAPPLSEAPLELESLTDEEDSYEAGLRTPPGVAPAIAAQLLSTAIVAATREAEVGRQLAEGVLQAAVEEARAVFAAEARVARLVARALLDRAIEAEGASSVEGRAIASDLLRVGAEHAVRVFSAEAKVAREVTCHLLSQSLEAVVVASAIASELMDAALRRAARDLAAEAIMGRVLTARLLDSALEAAQRVFAAESKLATAVSRQLLSGSIEAAVAGPCIAGELLRNALDSAAFRNAVMVDA
ncbi:hypothetical protein AB1Y20_014944 [Prymnesium parvum]|uniref:PH domain-containing protein n=1 Tax=Prymnesium parvum TaxID=97485 RepID=A0AB34JVP3_PRYPA